VVLTTTLLYYIAVACGLSPDIRVSRQDDSSKSNYYLNLAKPVQDGIPLRFVEVLTTVHRNEDALCSHRSRFSSVSIVTRLRTKRLGFDFRHGQGFFSRLLNRVQTGSGNHPASYTMGEGKGKVVPMLN
jgi:hypothetical protein